MPKPASRAKYCDSFIAESVRELTEWAVYVQDCLEAIVPKEVHMKSLAEQLIEKNVREAEETVHSTSWLFPLH